MDGTFITTIGLAAALLTTLCWIPQALKIIREKDTRALSLTATVTLVVGVGLWLIYGVMQGDLPLIAANSISFLLLLVIVALKLRHG
jgi:MtN3 and saliva related transmembrane protein